MPCTTKRVTRDDHGRDKWVRYMLTVMVATSDQRVATGAAGGGHYAGRVRAWGMSMKAMVTAARRSNLMLVAHP
jgi:hypothetical protein